MASDQTRSLTTETEIAAYLHRARMTILDVLHDGPATTTQIAARLGVHPANLTRHVRLLEQAGLVRLVEKRDTGRNLEKYYAATARRFRVAPGSAGLTAPHKIALGFVRSELSAALVRLPDETADPVLAQAIRVRLRPGAAASFAAELARLGERFSSAGEHDGQAYEIVLALYPGDPSTQDEHESIRLPAGTEPPR